MSGFSYPAPFEFEAEKKNENKSAYLPPPSPSRGRKGSVVRSKSNDENFFNSKLSQSSPRRQAGRSKSNDETFFNSALVESPRRPTRQLGPKTKSGRRLPKPGGAAAPRRGKKQDLVPNNSRGAGSKGKDFVRKVPGKSQSAGNLDYMQNVYSYQDPNPQPADSSKPTRSTTGTSTSTSSTKSKKQLAFVNSRPRSPEASPEQKKPGSLRKLLLKSPMSRKAPVKTQSANNLVFMQRSLVSQSDHGSTSSKQKKPPSLRNLLRRPPGRSKSSEDSADIGETNHSAPEPTERRGRMRAKKRTSSSRDRSESPDAAAPKKDKTKTFKDLLRKTPGRSKSSDLELMAESNVNNKGGIIRERSMSPIRQPAEQPMREPSLSPEEIKKPASGLLTGFLDSLYDSFIADDNDGEEDSDEDNYNALNGSISRFDAGVNKLAGLA